MLPRLDPSTALRALAAAQSQVLSAEQCHAYGLTRHAVARLLGQGHWRRLTNGLYCVQPGEPPWLAYAWAGVLLGGDWASLGEDAAGHLSGLIDSPPEVITVMVPEEVRRADRGRWHFIRQPAGHRLPARGAPPRTGVEDTVLDLCARAGPEQVAGLVSGAVQRRRTTPQRLLRRLDDRVRVTQGGLIRELLAEVSEGAESPLEISYLREVERAHGLPSGRRQALRGRELRDVVYEEFAVITELDGRLGHEGLGRFRDMDRDNRALVAGEVTLRFGWADVRGDPCRVAALVAEVLRQRGWAGQPHPCDRCRRVA